MRLFPLLLGAIATAQGPADLDPLPDREWTPRMARHLLHRAGFGGTAADVMRLHDLGLEAAVDELVDCAQRPSGPEPLALARELRAPAELREMSEADRRAYNEQRNRTERRQIASLRAWWLRAMAESPRPLEEKLTLFWHSHFAVEYRTVRDSVAMQRQNALLRRHALGSFADLLHGVARDPAMLRYLDADRNVRGKPNENLAREIMELFAMGEGLGYTETDVREGARALTGAAFDRQTLEYRFRLAQHDEGRKTLLGREGRFGPPEFVDLILAQPATARHVARKLFAFFAHDDADPALIESLAATLRENGYQLAPLLKRIFRSRAFYSDRSVGRRIKSPVELMIGTIRTLGPGPVDYRRLDQAIAEMGQRLFDPPGVRGWIEGGAWIDTSRILLRHNAVAALLRGRGAGPDAIRAATPEELLARLELLLLPRPLSAEARARLLGLVDPPAEDGPALRAALLLLLTTLPEYQLT
jgi:uncharacterized protein (DUF1800 family)